MAKRLQVCWRQDGRNSEVEVPADYHLALDPRGEWFRTPGGFIRADDVRTIFVVDEPGHRDARVLRDAARGIAIRGNTIGEAC